MNTATQAFILYDVNDHSLTAYVASVQETFLIATMGTRAEARGYTEEHACELVRLFRGVGRTMKMEVRP